MLFRSTTEGTAHFPITRPASLKADVVRFQNNKDKWIAFIGLMDNKPYEIFTGLNDDEDGILLPRWVNEGTIIKNKEVDALRVMIFNTKINVVIRQLLKVYHTSSIRNTGIMRS